MRNPEAALILFLCILCVFPMSAWAEDLVAQHPGVMCISPEALARLTLPDGRSRTSLPEPRPVDLSVKATGGCIDIPAGARVTVLTARRNTSIVSYDPGDGLGAHQFIVPNIDFANAPAVPRSVPAASVQLAYSKRLGVEVFSDHSDWCESNIALHVTAQSDQALQSLNLATLLERLAAEIIARRCSAAKMIAFDGSVGSGAVTWHRIANVNDNWILHEVAAPSQEQEVNLDDPGATGPALGQAQPNISPFAPPTPPSQTPTAGIAPSGAIAPETGRQAPILQQAMSADKTRFEIRGIRLGMSKNEVLTAAIKAGMNCQVFPVSPTQKRLGDGTLILITDKTAKNPAGGDSSTSDTGEGLIIRVSMSLYSDIVVQIVALDVQDGPVAGFRGRLYQAIIDKWGKPHAVSGGSYPNEVAWGNTSGIHAEYSGFDPISAGALGTSIKIVDQKTLDGDRATAESRLERSRL